MSVASRLTGKQPSSTTRSRQMSLCLCLCLSVSVSVSLCLSFSLSLSARARQHTHAHTHADAHIRSETQWAVGSLFSCSPSVGSLSSSSPSPLLLVSLTSPSPLPLLTLSLYLSVGLGWQVDGRGLAYLASLFRSNLNLYLAHVKAEHGVWQYGVALSLAYHLIALPTKPPLDARGGGSSPPPRLKERKAQAQARSCHDPSRSLSLAMTPPALSLLP